MKKKKEKKSVKLTQKTERNSALFFRKTLETNHLSMGTCGRSFRRSFSITMKGKKTRNQIAVFPKLATVKVTYLLLNKLIDSKIS